MARWARDGNQIPHALADLGPKDYVVYQTRQAIFNTSLAALDLYHHFHRGVVWLVHLFRPRQVVGDLETTMQREIQELAKREFGVEIDEAAFAG